MVLFFFYRLPLRPYQIRMLKICAVLCGISYYAVICTITWSCLPFHRNWATIPYPPPQCTDRTQDFYTTSILNVVTDFAVLTIALPLLWQLRVSVPRRIELTLLLCSGIFVATAALTTMFMALTNPESTLNTNIWGTREEIAGIVAVNAPHIKPLFHRSFWRRDFDPSKRPRMLPPRRRMAVKRGKRISDKPLIVAGRTETMIAMLSRRLGILTSVQSLSSGPTTGGGVAEKGSVTQPDQSTAGSQSTHEDKFRDLEWAWGVADAVEDPSLPRGPRPLLPEPTPSYSSGNTAQKSGGLDPIVEEDDSIMVIEGATTASSRPTQATTTDAAGAEAE